ncbi:MAG: AAA family ATPase [Magnetococcales bacterium]|nr:AAA family ATPase [Magnetococcales bacterium]
MDQLTPLTCLYESERTLIQRVRVPDGQFRIQKILKKPYPTPTELADFQREFDLIKRLKTDWVIQATTIKPYNNSLAFLMEDIGGRSLDIIYPNQSISLDDFFVLALKMVRALADIHDQGVIHKDINPSNIIWNGETNQLKIIDFGLSSNFVDKEVENQNLNSLEGTLPYISPEQTGRMNRPVDSRSDLYSLGATFYQLLTGRLPFTTLDHLDLAWHHIAKLPRPPHHDNQQLPIAISQIIMKLLEKDPNERYQSAIGLEYDLKTAEILWKDEKKIHSFPLGSNDIPTHFRLSSKIYGRKDEIQVVLDTFENTIKGDLGLLIVKGYAGIGKSMLVQEAQLRIGEKRGKFARGKFDQLNRNVMYAPIIQIFHSLLMELSAKDEKTVQDWQTKFHARMENNGAVIADIISELEVIVGAQPPLTNLPPNETKNRLHRAFINFLSLFAEENSPLVLFLDDLQWADISTLQLLESLFLSSSLNHMLLIVSYRNNEVNNIHPAIITIENIANSGINTVSIELKPLQESDVNQLIVDSFRSMPEESLSLAELCTKKTHGNPFFLNRFLRTLHEQKLIYLQENRWQWDMGTIEKENITKNVVDILSKEILNLNTNSRKILSYAACMGNSFDIFTLVILTEIPHIQVALTLAKSVSQELIVPLDNQYRLACITDTVNSSFRFAHDRVQQTAYTLIEPDKKKTLHLHIGCRLRDHSKNSDIDDELFLEIVNHLNLSASLIEDSDERRELAQFNLRAGLYVQKSAAFEIAMSFFSSGLNMLSDSDWSSDRTLTMELHIAAAEAAYLTTDFNKMEQLAAKVLTSNPDKLDRLRIYEIKIQALMAQKQQLKAILMGLDALGSLGINLPSAPKTYHILAGYGKIRHILRGWTPQKLLALPQMSDPIILATMRLISKLYSPAYFATPNLVPLLSFKQIELSIKHGNSEMSPVAYGSYAFVLCGIFDKIEEGYRLYQTALKIQNKYKSTQFKAKTILIGGLLVQHWKEHLHSSLSTLLDGYRIGLESGDLEYSTYSLLIYLEHTWFLGTPLNKVNSEMDRYCAVIDQLKQKHIHNYIIISHQTVLNLMDENGGKEFLVGERCDENVSLNSYFEENQWTAIFTYYLHKLILCYLFQKYSEAETYGVKAREYMDAALGTFDQSIFLLYETLSLLTPQNLEKPYIKRMQIMQKARKNCKKLKFWADLCPMNFSNKYHLAKAEFARASNKPHQALKHFDLSIAEARKYGFIHEEALAYELAGKFFKEDYKTSMWEFYLLHALNAYEKWGAKALVKEIIERYPSLRMHSQHNSQDGYNFSSIQGNSGDFFDSQSILKTYQALSQEVELNLLLERLMKILIQNTGAQQGCLVLMQEELPHVVISGRTDNTFQLFKLEEAPVLQGNNSLIAPVEIVQLVLRTGNNCVLKDARVSHRFMNTYYVKNKKPISVLCVPMIYQNSCIGAIYLENNLSSSAFSENLVKVTDLIGVQAAISLTNAKILNDSRNTEEFLRQSQKQLRRLTQREQTIKERELKRIAYEMHDELGGILTRILMESDLMQQNNILEGKALVEASNQIMTLTKQGIQTIRNISRNLRPKILDQFGLIAALELEAQQYENHFSCHFDIDEEIPRFPESKEIFVYRIVQETITNVARHAQASKVFIKFYKKSDDIILQISDNGIGFPLYAIKNGNTLGVQGMRERAILLGGSVDISLRNGGGTIVTLTIPESTLNDRPIEP